MIKFEHINKPSSAKQPAFAFAMVVDYRAQENTCGALIM
jgi:hypothetical protein